LIAKPLLPLCCGPPGRVLLSSSSSSLSPLASTSPPPAIITPCPSVPSHRQSSHCLHHCVNFQPPAPCTVHFRPSTSPSLSLGSQQRSSASPASSTLHCPLPPPFSVSAILTLPASLCQLQPHTSTSTSPLLSLGSKPAAILIVCQLQQPPAPCTTSALATSLLSCPSGSSSVRQHHL
jgi:hypothetical protein